jgi:phosphodiesterase/alkaline phosphatase D-like protein
MRLVRAAFVVLAALSAAGTLTATALAAEPASGGGRAPVLESTGPFGRTPDPLDRAREESGVQGRPATRFAVPSGRLDVTPSELLAGRSGQRLRFTVTLQRPTPDAALLVRLPTRWLAVGPSGLPGARAPALREGASGRAGLHRRGTLVEVAFDSARTGDRASFEVTDVGIPAGTYELPFFWRNAAGRTKRAGTAEVRFYAPSRDPPTTTLATPGVAANASNDSTEESESFIAVDPADRNRIAVGINWSAASMPLWITTDEGLHWTQRVMPQAIDQPGTATTENGDVCCDPTLTADALGNIWFGGLTLPNGGANPSRIVVNRIAAGGTTFQAQTVGLPVGASGTQDKPMMTIDNTSTSPTFGRLFVVWDEPASGGVRVVVSTCDTRPGGVSNAANCDNADHWTTPARITGNTGGSYIYADVAVGPTGKAYVTWWDYSNTNAIRGSTCTPPLNCATAANWTGAQNIALLDSTGGAPVPFACPILAQPGGRAAPDPQVDVDHSGGANNGRVYVTWGDLHPPGGGSTRCADATTPAASHQTWDAFVAIGSAGGAFPAPAAASANVGTRLLTDGELGGQNRADNWFPWLAIDQSTGVAWADFYSTRDDATRKTANFYARSVTASGSTLSVGSLNKVSTGASDYSSITPSNPCCNFRNDYGDYTGLDAAGGVAYPVWSDNSTGDGEAFTFISTLGPQRPTVVTGSTNGIGQSTATVNGTVNPNGQSTTYHFDYGTTPAYGSSTPDANAGSSGAAQSESASLSGLSPNTTYHYRLVATNGTGSTQGLDQTFTTAAAPVAPTAVTGAASGIGDSDATVNGTVNPQGQGTSYHFEYGLSMSYGQSTTAQPIAASNADRAVSASLSGLATGTTYHYRLVAGNGSGTTNGSDMTFTTTGAPPPTPVVVTGSATGLGETTATLGGTVNPNGLNAQYHFEYGTTNAYGSSTPNQAAGSGSADVQASADLSGLSPNTLYHYRLVATNTAGGSNGFDATFTTSGPAPPPPSAPTVTTVAATGMTTSAATLNATVNPNGQATTYWFEYGTTIGLGSETAHLNAGSGNTDDSVATTLSGLSPGTTYFFRVAASNSSGPVTDGTLNFTTASTPPPGGGGSAVTTIPPAPGGTDTPPPAAGTTRPSFTLSVTFPSQRLGTVLGRRALRASAGCAATCRLAARLIAPAGTARNLGLTRGRGAVELGRATIAHAAAHRTSLSIPVSRRALRALTGRSTVSIELRVTGTPLDGRAPITRAVRLTLRRRGPSPTVIALRASAAAPPVWLGWDALGALR